MDRRSRWFVLRGPATTLLRITMLLMAVSIGMPSSRTAAADGLTPIGAETRLQFRHFAGTTGRFHLPEVTGAGLAFVDYDRDGDLDVYLVQGTLLDDDLDLVDALVPPAELAPPTDRLFRNDLQARSDGRLEPVFVDVTEASGIHSDGYGMGVAIGDYDGDGWPDVYVTNLGDNLLLRNRGDGSFEDLTTAAGAGDPRWSTSAIFVDVDLDGWLDLYVVNYVDYSLTDPPRCYAPSSRRDYCGPSAFEPVPDRLLRNRGDGTFEDVSVIWGIASAAEPGLGVVTTDVTGDGTPEIAVANDGRPNLLWTRRGTARFVDDALFGGLALNRKGEPEASMGIVSGDFDEDGDEDLFMTHLSGETNTLYANDGGLFEDRTIEIGLAATSLPDTAFGTAFADLDGDGWLDLVVVNGAVRVNEGLAEAGDPFPLAQPNQVFRNRRGVAFDAVTATWAPTFLDPEVSRGLAVGDVDGDGDPDLLISNANGPVRLFRNDLVSPSSWIGVRLVGATSGGTEIGPRAIVSWGPNDRAARVFRAGGSFCSSSDPRVFVGLGERGAPETLEVDDPGRRRLRLVQPPVGRWLTIERSRQR